MDKSKLSQWGERLKTGGAQMSRMVSDKMKEMLQTPTPESKMVDEATAETLEESNWGMNLRICAMINSEEFNGTEIVRAIKRKIAGKSPVSQRLSLDLLEACAMNCEKVFSEVASEKVLDEMVKMIENPQTDQGNRDRAAQLIRAWGQSPDLEYLPVFHQTYMSLQERNARQAQAVEEGNPPSMQRSLESYIHQQPLPPPGTYPMPETDVDASNAAFGYDSLNLSTEQKNEYIVTTRNSIELLSSILTAESETKALQEDLTVSLLEKCRQSQPVIQRIIESTTDDEAMMFEALNLNDELQQVISRYEELEAGPKPEEQSPETSANPANNAPAVVEQDKELKPEDSLKALSINGSSEKTKADESSSKNRDEANSNARDESSSNKKGSHVESS